MGLSLRAVCVIAAMAMLCTLVLGGERDPERLETARLRHSLALERFNRAQAELREAEAAATGHDASVIRTSQAEPGPGQPDADAPEPDEPKGDAAPPPDLPEDPPGFFDWQGWTKSLTIGLNGASGNASFFSTVVTASLERKTERRHTRLEGWYRSTNRAGRSRENRAKVDLRHDRLAGESGRLRWWMKGTYEYDEGRAWLQRVSGHAGLGYDLLSDDQTTLGVRMGLGGTQELGGADPDFEAEALLTGLDFSHDFAKGRTVTAGTELFMDLDESEEFRIISSLKYEVLLDAERGLLLRAGLDHRYESRPEGSNERHDLFYAVSLGWRF